MRLWLIFCAIVFACCVLDRNPEGIGHTITITLAGACFLFFLKGVGYLFFPHRVKEKSRKTNEESIGYGDLDPLEREALRERRRRMRR